MSDYKFNKSTSNISLNIVYGPVKPTNYDKYASKKSNDTFNGDSLSDFFSEYNIPQSYQAEISNLINDISNNKKKYKRILKDWINDTDVPIADILNNILSLETGLEFKFTDDFIKKHSNEIVDVFLSVDISDALKGNVEFNFYQNIMKINSSKNLEVRLNAAISLMKSINHLNISYDELESQIPNLSEYLEEKIKLDGSNINRDTIKNLWDSIVNYDTGKFVLEQHEYTTSYHIYHALLDIYPNLLIDVQDYLHESDIYLTDDTTRYLIKCFISRAYSNSDFIEELFSLENKISNSNSFSAFSVLKNFCKEYDISLLTIGEGYVSESASSFIDSFFVDYSNSDGPGDGHHR